MAMAEYYTLLMRAVEGLPNKTQTARRAVYDRARAALINQLRSLEPPISEGEIVRERMGLDEAIKQIETEIKAAEFVHQGAETDERHELPEAVPGLARKPEPLEDIPAPDEEDSLSGPSVERPRISIIKDHGYEKRSLRSILVTSALAAVIAAIAVVAWLLKDSPSSPLLNPAGLSLEAKQDTKYSGRIGEPTRPEEPTLPDKRTGLASGSASLSESSPLAVAQRAVLFEENPSDPRSPVITQGRTLWRLEPASGGQGQPLDNVVRAQVTMPEGGLSLTLTMRRNNDPALPASHTVELAFRTAPSDPSKAVRDVGQLQLKVDEASLGAPMAGLPVPVKDNLSLIGLSNLPADIERNRSMLLQRNWIDIPIRFASGRRAVLSLEKGSSGDQAFAEAFRQWGQ
jgi:hypothetical protein